LNPDDVYCQVRAVLDETNLKEVIAMKSYMVNCSIIFS